MGSRGRVLHVGPLPPPAGGMASVVDDLAQDLSPALQVRVLDSAGTTAAHLVPWPRLAAQAQLLWQVAALCLAWRPAVVHVHTLGGAGFWGDSAVVLVARLLGRKVVLHIHGGRFVEFLGGLGTWGAFAARRALRLAHRLLVLGEYARAPLAHWVPETRVTVLRPGVVPGTPAAPRTDGGDFRIACLSTGSGDGERYGLADLLRAVALLPQPERVRVQMAGVANTTGERAELQRLAALLGLAGQVEVIGQIVGADKAAWLRRADCFCLPSFAEAFPLTMLEMMAIGRPVVVTPVGAVPEVVRHGQEGLLFEPGDLATLAAHLQRLIDEPALCGRIGQRGRARVLTQFSQEASLRRLRRVYHALAHALPADLDEPATGTSAFRPRQR